MRWISALFFTGGILLLEWAGLRLSDAPRGPVLLLPDRHVLRNRNRGDRSCQPFGALAFGFASMLSLQHSNDVSPVRPTGTFDARRSNVTRLPNPSNLL